MKGTKKNKKEQKVTLSDAQGHRKPTRSLSVFVWCGVLWTGHWSLNIAMSASDKGGTSSTRETIFQKMPIYICTK